MDQPDPPQFVTGHLSVWDEDDDEGMMQDVGVVHYMGVDVVQGLVIGWGLGR